MDLSQIIDIGLGLAGGYYLAHNYMSPNIFLHLEHKDKYDDPYKIQFVMTRFIWIPIAFIGFAVYHSGGTKDVLGAIAVGGAAGYFEKFQDRNKVSKMPIIIGPIGSNSGGSAGGVSLLDVVLKWPLLAVSEVQNGSFIPTLVALGAGYYVGGGLPGGGQSLQTYAMAYAAAGLGMYGALMVLAPAPVKN